MNVLVVDDDKDLLDMVTLVLSKNGMKVTCLDSGSQLFDQLQMSIPDIVLMDIYLGDSDGRELCKKIKISDDYKEIPVILYSAGNIHPHTIQESLADDFIAKPFDIHNLVRKLQLSGEKQ